MKNVLIATDFSPHSQYTTKYILDLFAETQIPCRILLLNTYLAPTTDKGEIIKLNDELKTISKKGLESEKAQALKLVKGPHIKIETSSHLGTLRHVISRMIKSGNIDLVAMGKDGGKHVEVISALLKEQHCPLLITYNSASQPSCEGHIKT